MKNVSFGNDCCSSMRAAVRIEECRAVESMEFKEKSFSRCYSMQLKNLKSLKTLSFGKFCFRSMEAVEISGICYLWILRIGLPSLETVNAASPSRKPKKNTIAGKNMLCCCDCVDVSEHGAAALKKWMR